MSSEKPFEGPKIQGSMPNSVQTLPAGPQQTCELMPTQISQSEPRNDQRSASVYSHHSTHHDLSQQDLAPCYSVKSTKEQLPHHPWTPLHHRYPEAQGSRAVAPIAGFIYVFMSSGVLYKVCIYAYIHICILAKRFEGRLKHARPLWRGSA